MGAHSPPPAPPPTDQVSPPWHLRPVPTYGQMDGDMPPSQATSPWVPAATDAGTGTSAAVPTDAKDGGGPWWGRGSVDQPWALETHWGTRTEHGLWGHPSAGYHLGRTHGNTGTLGLPLGRTLCWPSACPLWEEPSLCNLSPAPPWLLEATAPGTWGQHPGGMAPQSSLHTWK